MTLPVIIAHKSMTSTYGPNTIESMELLHINGIDYFEIDVSSDEKGNPVVVNPNDMRGRQGQIYLTFESIARWSKHRRVNLYIDIKYYKRNPELLQKVFSVIVKEGIIDHVTIISYDMEPLRDAKSQFQINTGHIINDEFDKTYCDADFLIIPFDVVKAKGLKIQELKIVISKVNSISAYRELTKQAVQYVITDHPILLQSIKYREYFKGLGSKKRMLNIVTEFMSYVENYPIQCLDMETLNGLPELSIKRLIIDLHRINYKLWHLEENVRTQQQETNVSNIKRSINEYNKLRNITVEEIDRCFSSLLGRRDRSFSSGSHNIVSIGRVIDKLSILFLKTHYLGMLIKFEKKLPEIESVCRVRMKILEGEKSLVKSSLQIILNDLLLSKTPMSIGSSLKTYDDELLNPYIIAIGKNDSVGKTDAVE